MDQLATGLFKTRFGFASFMLLLLSFFTVGNLLAQSGNAPIDENQQTGEDEEDTRPPVPKASDNTSLKLIALNEKIMGGRSKLLELQSYELVYAVKAGREEYQLKLTHKAPSSYRWDKTWRHLGQEYHEVMAFDGTHAWEQTVKPEATIPEWIPRKKRQQFIVDGEFLGPLFLHEGKSHIFQYTGEGKVANRKAFCVKAYLSDGRRHVYYFDKENFLINRITKEEQFGKVTQPVECFITKRSQRDGYYWDEERIWYVDGKDYRTDTLITARTNIGVEDDFFQPSPRREYWLRKR